MYHELYTNYIQTIYDETAGVPATTEHLLLSYHLTQMGEATEIPNPDIDKSLDLEKFLKRNDSNFYLSIAEANFHVSFSSRFSRIGGKFLFLLSIFKT